MDTLEERTTFDTPTRFQRASIALNVCQAKMIRLKNTLLVETVSPIDSFPVMDNITKMYDKLISERKTDQQMKRLASEKVRSSGSPKAYRHAQYEVNLTRLRQDNIQLDRLYETEASFNDRLILAEACVLRERYSAAMNGKLDMYIASCDSNNFSPIRDSPGCTMAVTNRIRQDCKIACDWPRRIANLLK